MLTFEKNDGTLCVFTQNKENDLNSFLDQLHILTKAGLPYKGVEITTKNYVKLYSNTSERGIVSTRIIYKENKYNLLNDSFDLRLWDSSAQDIVNFLSNFPSYKFKISGIEFIGPLKVVDESTIKDNEGKLLSLKTNIQDPIQKYSVAFILNLRNNNARILTPLIKRFTAALHFAGKNSSMIVGYANVNNFLKLIEQPSINQELKLLDNSDTHIVTFGGSNTAIKFNIKAIENNNLFHIESSSNMVITDIKKGKVSDGSINPYLLLSSRPINIGKEKLPSFSITLNRNSIFITLLMFSDSNTLKTLKGGMDLLRMW